MLIIFPVMREGGLHISLKGRCRMRQLKVMALGLLGAVTVLSLALNARAADHGDAPALAHDQGCDIADVYFFLDPNDNTRAILIATFHGFITPGEAVNFGIFDHNILYRFELENTG